MTSVKGLGPAQSSKQRFRISIFSKHFSKGWSACLCLLSVYIFTDNRHPIYSKYLENWCWFFELEIQIHGQCVKMKGHATLLQEFLWSRRKFDITVSDQSEIGHHHMYCSFQWFPSDFIFSWCLLQASSQQGVKAAAVMTASQAAEKAKSSLVEISSQSQVMKRTFPRKKSYLNSVNARDTFLS